MKEFQKRLYDLRILVSETKELDFSKICIKAGPNCLIGENALTFFTDTNNGNVNIPGNDGDIKREVRYGRGGRFQGNGNIINIPTIFGGTVPEKVN